MPRFKGKIARNLPSFYTYAPGTPFEKLSDQQRLELTEEGAHQLKTKLRNKPVGLLIEHQNVSVGKVEDAWVDPQSDGSKDFVVVVNVDDSSEAGKIVAERLNRGIRTGLSLGHRRWNDGMLEPDEVSIVEEPARSGCWIECKAN